MPQVLMLRRACFAQSERNFVQLEELACHAKLCERKRVERSMVGRERLERSTNGLKALRLKIKGLILLTFLREHPLQNALQCITMHYSSPQNPHIGFNN